jgi:hypothetical protein
MYLLTTLRFHNRQGHVVVLGAPVMEASAAAIIRPRPAEAVF